MRLSRPAIAALACAAALALYNCAKEPGTEESAPATSPPSAGAAPSHANVTGERILAADSEPGEWLSYGRTYGEQRFSPLKKINKSNVSGLKLAWYGDLDSKRGQESTPLFIDGVLYFTTAWSKVKAYDAATGEELWAYDPQVDGKWGVRACCDVVNRGLAAWNGKLYLGALDGRLIALDAATGKILWSKVTVDQSKPYTITGAPRVVKGKVIIGNGGAEFGVRGYVTAYDAETGDVAWRFYTVPGDPAKGFESPAMELAAATWKGEWWKLGGGGTVWDAMAYDPDTDLLYIGVGNGSPWNQAYRSPGGGDNLYLSSIVALNPDTGDYVWHFQETPGETWDYTATQHIIVADIPINGEKRKVLLHAPKNGFFYVVDARTGEFISGNNYVDVNWATGLDPKTGRPIENPDARIDKTGKPYLVVPGPGGAHSWHPMSFDPETGLVYIPANIGGFPFFPADGWEPKKMGFNIGIDFAPASMPADAAIKEATLSSVSGQLIAWDPVAQKAAWRVDYPGAGNGGLLSTAGGLVFQGTKGGEFIAYDAASGEKLWSSDVQTGVSAPPMSFELGGEQYIAVVAGWGGVEALAPGEIGAKGAGRPNRSRILVFSLDGDASLPPEFDPAPPPLDPPALIASSETVAHGAELYARFCTVCHGDAAHSAGLLPDLRLSPVTADHDAFNRVVIGGERTANGMVSFKDVLSDEDAEAIRAYAISRANEDVKLLEEAAKRGQ